MEELKDIISKFGTEDESQELRDLWEQVEYTKEDPEYTALKYRELQSRIARTKSLKIKRISVAAASVAAVVLVSFVALNIGKKDVARTVAFNYKEIGVSAPNGSVTMSVDGVDFNLNSKSVTMEQGDSTLSLLGEDGESVKEISRNKMITVKVPVGHQFEVVLSDGTKVWLNSDTKFMYPSNFDGNERRVRIIGEGYFDVTHNTKQPFIVSVDGKYDVKVLGTQFNIDSYPGGEVSRTTLVNGKVKVQFKGGGNEVDLSPSEQMTIDSLNCVEVGEVNTESFTSWREKRFVFDNEKLSDIAAKMERCYGMEIFVSESYRDLRFSGRVSYNRGVDYFIKVLKETEGINCEFRSGSLLVGVKK